MGRKETGETPEKDRNRRRKEAKEGTKEEKKRNESRVETAVRSHERSTMYSGILKIEGGLKNNIECYFGTLRTKRS